MALSALSHYMNQYWNIVNSTIRNTLEWNVNPNLYVVIQANEIETVVWEMAALFVSASNNLNSSRGLNKLKKTRRSLIIFTFSCVICTVEKRCFPSVSLITFITLLLSFLPGAFAYSDWVNPHWSSAYIWNYICIKQWDVTTYPWPN